MPLGSAASQKTRAGGDSTKKAPVDTVRLKKDIRKDTDASDYLNNIEGGNPKSNLIADQPAWRGAKALSDRATARKDTLEAARSGKIPAAAGKKKSK